MGLSSLEKEPSESFYYTFYPLIVGRIYLSELPEKKVLKKLITKLKSLTITSEEELKKEEVNFNNLFKETYAKAKQVAEEKKDKPEMKEIIEEVGNVILFLRLFSDNFPRSVHRHCENIKLYIEALEQYSIALDKTLTDLFEQARKQAEEEIKQQQELSKRTSPDAYTA